MNELLAKMLAKLTGAYSKDPESNIGRLFQMFAVALSGVEDTLHTVSLWRDLYQARGITLDRIGKNFGVARGAANDALYRIMIQVKIIAPLSGGDVNTVIRAARELLGVEDADILLEDVYPARVALFVDQNLLSQERIDLIDQIAGAIKRILAAGVGLRLYLRTYRTYRGSVVIAHAALIRTAGRLGPPSPQRACTAVQAQAGGAFCHTHITSKRIEL